MSRRLAQPGLHGLLLAGALCLAAVPSCLAQVAGRATDDMTWGGALTVARDEVHEGDLLALGGRIELDGHVTGDAVSVGGHVVVRGRVDGDVLALGGRVTIEEGADVRGNAFALVGSVEVEDPATVHGQVRSVLAGESGDRPSYFDLAFSRAGVIVRLTGLTFWILAALAAAFAAPSTVVQAATEVRRRPLRLAVIGLLVNASLALTAVLCIALVAIFVGIPLLFLLLLAWTALGAAALAATFHAVGERLAERALPATITGYAKILLGALLLGLVSFVPIAGEIVWTAAAFAGVGAIVTSRRR